MNPWAHCNRSHQVKACMVSSFTCRNTQRCTLFESHTQALNLLSLYTYARAHANRQPRRCHLEQAAEEVKIKFAISDHMSQLSTYHSLSMSLSSRQRQIVVLQKCENIREIPSVNRQRIGRRHGRLLNRKLAVLPETVVRIAVNSL